ncbi:hypothetical protein LJY25_11935 [Hymenobacter sp. BT175]|uniref:hypothetical protein n=1 Tax=Hymenobacter translucens TaxID=2886507 RepID=UPI001D0DE298|nr:hypothetical protein [Hymenobacter translucens]MCC2547159.1 hypothetical protein [Hymenobacter translucens]
MNNDEQQPRDASGQESPPAGQTSKRQPEGRQFASRRSNALRGLNADDNSGSGGTEGGKEIKGSDVSKNRRNYKAPGNADRGHVGGSTVSSGTGVSGGETGQVNL